MARPPPRHAGQGSPGRPHLHEGHGQALAKGGARQPRTMTVAMMPAPPASERVENQQGDKQGQKDEGKTQKGCRIAENVAEDYFGIIHAA
jgi:hypothetical protein